MCNWEAWKPLAVETCLDLDHNRVAEPTSVVNDQVVCHACYLKLHAVICGCLRWHAATWQLRNKEMQRAVG